jgi:RNA polymerase sigma factor (sigma-70 family)
MITGVNAEDHTGLVYFHANRTQTRWGAPEEFDDLVGVGNVALVKAAAAFDPGRGYKFATYASRAINNAMWDWMTCKRHPLHFKYGVVFICLAINKFENEHGRVPTIEELRVLVKRKIKEEETYRRYLDQAQVYSKQVFQFREIGLEGESDERFQKDLSNCEPRCGYGADRRRRVRGRDSYYSWE